MFMGFVFQIKRRLADSEDVTPLALEPGEMAFDEISNTFYIGTTPVSGTDTSTQVL